ncbi:hypothetical protein [Nesterenkonia pannonica]|uniref:hypothetical protein n=1 Tax=Nesterenkonia pannonica TaxID=1548602 RepID=UPI00216448DD|nr:hypothetical protein [Nesterenkonia pannonica]
MGLAIPAELLTGESLQSVVTGLTSSLRTAAAHPMDTYPVVQLSGLHDVAGAGGLRALNELLTLLGTPTRSKRRRADASLWPCPMRRWPRTSSVSAPGWRRSPASF